jgi:hypothetical protein
MMPADTKKYPPPIATSYIRTELIKYGAPWQNPSARVIRASIQAGGVARADSIRRSNAAVESVKPPTQNTHSAKFSGRSCPVINRHGRNSAIAGPGRCSK